MTHPPMCCKAIGCDHNVPHGEDLCAECVDLIKLKVPESLRSVPKNSNYELLTQTVKAAAPVIDDPVHHPKHYTSHPSGIECIQVTEHFGFNLGNTIKYLWRAEEKGAPLQDLEKARWYLDREIQKRKAK